MHARRDPHPIDARPRVATVPHAEVVHAMGRSPRPGRDQNAALALVIRRAWLQGDQDTLVRALRLIAPRCDYSSRELARVLGISARHLQRIFSRTMGATPQDWLNEERLQAAKASLPRASSVKEVAFTLGFRSLSQLARDFRKHFEVTPSSLLAAQASSAPALRASAQEAAAASASTVDDPDRGRSPITDDGRQS
jgi:AraC-like DNA-binding protein